ncbi:MAG: hypothetical protein DRJ61_01180 [Acidobacteria bacterium]|nr:MAG: hypothetical protein DRJ61_01180 [Acidobacteriota bacterium]
MIISAMTIPYVSAPLVRWDDLHVVFDIPTIERILRLRLAEVEALSNPDLDGQDDRLALVVRVHWKSVSMRVRVELREIRLRHRRLGFRLGHLRALGGLPVPRIAVLRTLQEIMPDRVTVLPGSDVVVVDLRTWIPPEVQLRIVAVQVVGEALHVWLASGSVTDIPLPQNQQLSAGNPEKSLPPRGSVTTT